MQTDNRIPKAHPSVPPGARVRIRRGYTLREIAGEYLAVPVSDEEGAAGRLAILNGTGKYLFALLEEETTPEKLLKNMLDAFDVSPPEAEADIAEFLSALAKNGLLHIHSREDEK